MTRAIPTAWAVFALVLSAPAGPVRAARPTPGANPGEPPITPPPRGRPKAPSPTTPAPGMPPAPGAPPVPAPSPQYRLNSPDVPPGAQPSRRNVRVKQPLARYKTLYASVAGAYAFYSAGHLEFTNTGSGPGASMESYAGAGVHLALYYIFIPWIHGGVFASYLGGRHKIESDTYGDSNKSVHEVAGGITGKVGFPLGRKMWLGGAMDVGGVFLRFSAFSSPSAGLYLYPKVVFDIIVADLDFAKVGVYGTLGAMVVPFLKGRFTHNNVTVRHEGWLVRSGATVGLHLGF